LRRQREEEEEEEEEEGAKDNGGRPRSSTIVDSFFPGLSLESTTKRKWVKRTEPSGGEAARHQTIS